MTTQAVIFDMDGILIDSEVIWEQERVAFAAQRGKVWSAEHQAAVMGGTSREWACAMKTILSLDNMSVEDVIDAMLARMNARYRQHLPVIPGAVDAVLLAASRYPVGLASGSPAGIIQEVLVITGLDKVFQVVVSGDEMKHGKPAPDIYLEAARRLGAHAERCVGIEDSGNGIRSLKAAGMWAIAIPHPAYIPKPEVLALADLRLDRISDLTLAHFAAGA
jgi:HAD superfamily hydrolase (TIGR01509 family)